MFTTPPDWLFLAMCLVILILVLIAIVKYITRFNYEALGHVDHIPKHPDKYRFYLLGLAIYVPLTEFILEIYKVREQSELTSNIVFGIVALGLFFLTNTVKWIRTNIYSIFLFFFNIYSIYVISILVENPSQVITMSEFTLLIVFSYLVFHKIFEFALYNFCILFLLFTFHLTGFFTIQELVQFTNVIVFAIALNFANNFINQRLYKNILISHTIVNSGSMFAFSIDEHGFIDYTSNNIFSILEIPENTKIKGKSLEGILHISGSKINLILSQKKQITHRFTTPSGNEKNFQLEKLKIQDEKIFISCTDITDYTKLKNSLEIQQNRLKTILMNTGDLIFVLNSELVFTEVFNRNIEDLYNIPEFYINKNLNEVGYSEKVYHKLEHALYDAAKTNLPTSIEYSVKLHHGIQWYDMKIYVIKDYNGKIIEYVLVSRNISDKKEAQFAQSKRQKIIEKQNKILVDFSLQKYNEKHSIDSIANTIVQVLAEMLNVSRVSIWMYRNQKIECYKLFSNQNINDFPGLEIIEQEHPNYFSAIKNGLIVLADNALNHPDTAEFSKDYFSAYHIKSLLDVPIRNQGELMAVICCEQTDTFKNWTIDDANFVKHIADIFSIELIQHNRIIAEEQLEHTKKILDQSNRIAKLGAWEYRVESNEIIWSDITKEILHLPLDYIPSHSLCLDQIPDLQTKNKLIDLFNNAVEHGHPIDIEVQAVLNTHETQWLRIIAQPEIVNGKIICICGAFQNIDEQVSSRIALTQSEAYFQQINETIEDVFWLYDIERKEILYINPACKKLFGYNQEEYYARHDLWKTYTVEEDIPKVMEAHRKLIEQNYFEIEYRYIKNGQIRWLFEKSFGIKNEQGKITKNSGLIIDITKQKEIEFQLEINKTLESEHKAKAAFLANMSHEIRTPLNGIIGLSDLLKNTPLNETQSKYIHTLNDSAHHLNELINNILDFSKIEAGKFELNHNWFDLNELCQKITSMMSYQAELKGLSFKLIIDDHLPKYIDTDETRLKQILLNLLSNAIKFTPNGSIQFCVEVIETEENQKVRFSILDTGIGIKASNLKRIFEAFTQEDSSTTKLYGGTGLGLAIAEKLLNLMNSSIQVYSEVGKGSTFYFDLDMSMFNTINLDDLNIVNKTNDTIQTESINSLSDSLVCLIVEDNTVNLFLLKAILKDIVPSCTIYEAENGQKAIDIIQSIEPDIIFMDIQMPLKNGYETTQDIRKLESKQHIPIIAITAGTVPGEQEKCLQCGMNDFLTKPIVKQTIYNILHKWLGSKDSIHNIPLTELLQTNHIDFSKLEEMNMSNGVYLKSIFPFIRESLMDGLDELKFHLQKRDYKSMAIVAHRLKGTALTAAFTTLGQLTQELEHHHFNDFQSVKSLVEVIEKEIKYLVPIL
jgi:PAS domain S-box-containing protein